MKNLKLIALILVIIGAINWGLVGLFGFNLVSALLGVGIFARIVYVLVGLSAILVALDIKKSA